MVKDFREINKKIQENAPKIIRWVEITNKDGSIDKIPVVEGVTKDG